MTKTIQASVKYDSGESTGFEMLDPVKAFSELERIVEGSKDSITEISIVNKKGFSYDAPYVDLSYLSELKKLNYLKIEGRFKGKSPDLIGRAVRIGVRQTDFPYEKRRRRLRTSA